MKSVRSTVLHGRRRVESNHQIIAQKIERRESRFGQSIELPVAKPRDEHRASNRS